MRLGESEGFHSDFKDGFPLIFDKEIVSEVRERIEAMGKSGGYILSPVHTVESDVPIENIFAFYEAAREYGSCG
jgi:uroporphyrinogen decarboxylase